MDSRDLRNLSEAWQRITASDFLSEEVVGEDVEVLDEASAQGGRVTGSNPTVYKAAERPAGTRRGAAAGTRQIPSASSAPKPQIGSLPPSARQVTQYPAGVPTGVGTPKPAPTPAATKPAPTATTAKPAPTSTTAPTAPAAKPLSDVGKMIQASQMRQKGANVTSDMISDKSVKAPEPKPQLSARAQALKAGGPAGGARGRMLNQDLDLFDIVKGHLLDEGYADTEEAALAIMANMSEEWKQTILEADSVAKMAERAAKRRQQRYGKQGGGGRDDYRPYTEDDYKNPKPGYGSSQVKGA